MANISTETRKDQVLRYLQQNDRWVDGPELANAQVGGSEGLKRVRELRQEGHRIITRPHPDRSRDVFQYKLIRPESIAPVIQERLMTAEYEVTRSHVADDVTVVDEAKLVSVQTPGVANRPFLIRKTEEGLFELTKEVCVECGGLYDDDLEHRTTDAKHLSWMKAEEQRTKGQLTVGVPEQPPPYRFIKMPDKIDLGTMAWCPRCQGKRRKKIERFSRKQGATVVTEAEDFTRDPFHPTTKGEPNLCPRCGGLGIIPTHVEEGNSAMQPVRG